MRKVISSNIWPRQIIVDNEVFKVFEVWPSGWANVYPGFTQLTCGKGSQPTHGFTLPNWWVNNPDSGRIYTSGHWFGHVKGV